MPCGWAALPSPASTLNPSVSVAVGVYGNWSLPFLSITLHLKISCPSSPAMPMGRGIACPVPQVKIEMESDYDSDIDHHRPRDMSSETTLWSGDLMSCWQSSAQWGVGRTTGCSTEPLLTHRQYELAQTDSCVQTDTFTAEIRLIQSVQLEKSPFGCICFLTGAFVRDFAWNIKYWIYLFIYMM